MFKNYIKERHPFFFNILSNLKSKMITLSTNIYKYLNKFYFFRIINYKLNPSFRKFKVYSYLKKDSVFIDIGANIGLYSLFVSDKYNSNIECFEPHPQAFNILSKRFKNKTKVKLNNLAVSDVEGTTELYLHQEEGSNKDDYSESASLYSEKFNVDPNKKIQIKTVDINKIAYNF